MAAIATAVLTCLLGSQLFGRRAGLGAGLILATSAGFFTHSQVMLPDMLMAAFTTAALLAFWRSVSAPAERIAIVGFYAALAFAVFSKGPAGLLPLLAAGIWLLTEYGLPGLARLWSPAGLAIFAAVTLIWLAPFLSAGSQSFGEAVLWGDWLSWYLGVPLPRRVAQFLLDAFVGLLPWSPVLALGLVHAVRSRRDPAVRWALLSFLVPLAVIVMSSARLRIYLLPVYPAAAILVAWWADTRGTERTRLARVFAWLSLATVVIAIAVAPWIPDVKESEVFLMPGFIWKALPLAVAVLMLGGVLFWGLSRGRPAVVVYGGVALMAVVLIAGVRLNSQVIRMTQDFRVVAAALERHGRGGDMRLFSASLLLPVDFYVGRQLVRMQTAPDLRQYLARARAPRPPGRPALLAGLPGGIPARPPCAREDSDPGAGPLHRGAPAIRLINGTLPTDSWLAQHVDASWPELLVEMDDDLGVRSIANTNTLTRTLAAPETPGADATAQGGPTADPYFLCARAQSEWSALRLAF